MNANSSKGKSSENFGEMNPPLPQGKNQQKKSAVSEEEKRQQLREKIKAEKLQLPEVLLIDLDGIENKPWLEEGADISDYFNYGFDEETFKSYQQKCRDKFSTLDKDKIVDNILDKNLDLDHKNLNFYLPHECGGIGMPQDKEYDKVNTYRVGKYKDKNTDEIIEDDAPVLCNKSYGYFAKITKNGIQSALDNQAEGEGDAMNNMLYPDQVLPGMWSALDPNTMVMPDDLNGGHKGGKNNHFKRPDENSKHNFSIDRKRKSGSKNDRKRRKGRDNHNKNDNRDNHKRRKN